jgi:hypothetical protein
MVKMLYQTNQALAGEEAQEEKHRIEQANLYNSSLHYL